MQSQVQGMVARPSGALAGYDPAGYFCELRPCAAVSAVRRLIQHAARRPRPRRARARARAAEAELYNLGITFTVYSDKDAIDRILPFDVIPRADLAPRTGPIIESGVRQRVTALNLFLPTSITSRRCSRTASSRPTWCSATRNYRPEMRGLDLPHGTYVHINGTDLVRDGDGTFQVLEDNARTPSGVSYVVENRHLMLRAFSDLMTGLPVRPVSDYGAPAAREAVRGGARGRAATRRSCCCRPASYNSAYFEHVFLAREMGVPLVEGRDLRGRERPGLHAHGRRAACRST